MIGFGGRLCAVAEPFYIFDSLAVPLMKSSPDSASIESLLSYFNRLIPLNKEEQEMVRESFRSRSYRKKQYVLQEGDISTQFNYVISGCLRMYKVDDQGNIHILQFAPEGWWISDLGSFHSVSPSELNIDAIEDTEVLQIKRDDLITLYKQAPKFDRIFRVLIEKSFIQQQKRLLQTISSTADYRYQSFLDTYPQLVNRISQKQVASYLGITQEFLSRLRNRRANPATPKS